MKCAGCKNTKKRSRWRQVCAWNWKQKPFLSSPPSHVPLYNRYEALNVAHLRVIAAQLSLDKLTKPNQKEPSCDIKATSLKKRQVLNVSDSFPHRTEHLICLFCLSDPLLREVCCLPGAQVRNVTRKLPNLIWPTDYNPLLLFHVRRQEAATYGSRAIKRDFRAFG